MTKKKAPEGEMSFLEHLEELRWHLIRSALYILLVAIVLFISKSFVFDQVIFAPLYVDFSTYKAFCSLSNLWGGAIFCMDEMSFSLINYRMAGQFSTHIWVSIIGGFILAFPLIIYELWKFVSPGLKSSERKFSGVIIISASFQFFMGVLFGFYLIVPLAVQFLGNYEVSSQVPNNIEMNSYISMVTSILLSSGLLFELPIAVYILSKLGLITPEWLKTYRKHAIVVMLFFAAIITPPDVSSQILVMLPILLLYEISIIISKVVTRNK